MSDRLFFYGPLCHAPLRTVVLGLGHSVVEARASGVKLGRVAGTDQPALVKGTDEVVGLLIDCLDPKIRTRADHFAAGLGYVPKILKVTAPGQGTIPARVYVPAGDPPQLDGRWDLADWVDNAGPVWIAAAREAMALEGTVAPETLARRWPMAKLRAASRVRAGKGAAATVRASLAVDRDVEIIGESRPYSDYFALEELDLRFRRFDGGWSAPVRRTGFVGGDAATVLPYDPKLDSVLVVEQFRMGPYLRGDPRPWMLEPIAGRIDPGEAPEAAARREAEEEAGLRLGALHALADYYPSPGAVSEFVYSYVAEANLAGRNGVIGGQAGEDEDIRTHVIPFETMLELVRSGEAGTGPLILSVYWLALNRLRLWGTA